MWLTRMRHRPILGDPFRVQPVTDALASQVVQLFGASAPDRRRQSPCLHLLFQSRFRDVTLLTRILFAS